MLIAQAETLLTQAERTRGWELQTFLVCALMVMGTVVIIMDRRANQRADLADKSRAIEQIAQINTIKDLAVVIERNTTALKAVEEALKCNTRKI